MKEKLTRSSGNVFLDLGFPPEEAEHLKVRSDLMIHLFSVDTLIDMLARAGIQVKLVVTLRKRKRKVA